MGICLVLDSKTRAKTSPAVLLADSSTSRLNEQLNQTFTDKEL